MKRLVLSAVLAVLSPVVRAQGAPGEAAFLSAARSASETLASPNAARRLRDDTLRERLLAYLGWYDVMERQPGVGAAAMSAAVVAGLTSGRYTGLILGESHGVNAEDAAGRLIVGDALSAGLPIGAFLREEYLFPHTKGLDAARVPVLTYKNQFKPEDDVRAGLKAAGGKLLISYTGCAHTSVALKDFFLYSLEEGKTWHYERGKHDMPTVEESFRQHGKRPLIVAMVNEETVLSMIQQLFLKSLSDGTDRPRLSADLDAVLGAWNEQMAAYPRRPGPIAFVRSPDQPELYAGLTPSERRAFELEAVRRVLDLPELAAWLGGGAIKSVESLRGGSFTPPNTREWHYDVIVHRASGGDFAREIPENELRAWAAAR